MEKRGRYNDASDEQLTNIELRLLSIGYSPSEESAPEFVSRLVTELVILRANRKAEMMPHFIDRSPCLRSLQETEPFFVLTGHDVITPAAIAFWAREAIRLNVPIAKVKDALENAMRIEAWQRENYSKVPD